MPADSVLCLPIDGIGEVGDGDDLALTLATALGHDGLEDGDVLVVTSKVLSKAEGRRVHQDKDAALAGETARLVARRGSTSIVRTHHGYVMAGAGIDSSNIDLGTVLLLPVDPDASARMLRDRLLELTERNVAVVVTDTAGRAWRHGQTDLAVGAAGIAVMHDYAGVRDGYGNELAVTAPAVVDEIAAAADLVKGKLARRPVAVLRGLADWVLPRGQHGSGATALVREESQDMFGYGARDAVLVALEGDPASRSGFGGAADAADVVRALTRLGLDAKVQNGRVDVRLPDPNADARLFGRLEATAHAAAFALGWLAVSPGPSGPAVPTGSTGTARSPGTASHDPTTVLGFERPTP